MKQPKVPLNLNKSQFRALEKEWYAKLQETGFEDIENVNKVDRPLKEWHSLRFKSKRIQILHSQREEYQNQIDSFKHHPGFAGVCRTLSRHKNASLRAGQIKQMWLLHCDGATVREIAAELGKPVMSVQDMIVRVVKWMNLL